MERFSSMAREVFKAVFYETDIDQAEDIIDAAEVDDQLGIAFGKCCTLFYYLACYDTEKLLGTLSELDTVNQVLNDPFIHLWTHTVYIWHYSGGDWPVIDADLTKQHFNSATEWYEWYLTQLDPLNCKTSLASKIVPDSWEIYFITGMYNLEKAQYYRKIDIDPTASVLASKEVLQNWKNMPRDGEYLSTVLPYGDNALGWFHLLNGDLANAEKWFLIALQSTKEYENLWELWPNMNLWNLNTMRGDNAIAKIHIERALEISRKYNYTWGIYINLRAQGDLTFDEGNYGEALELIEESTIYAMKFGDPLLIFSGYAMEFNYYYNRFKNTKGREFFEQASLVHEKLKGIASENPGHPTMRNSLHYCEARLLKHGNIRNKGKAIQLLEDLLEKYQKTQNFHIILELIDSLFEDALLTGDEGTINQIDGLMEGIRTTKFINNPTVIFNYTHQQILLAKYDFFILGKIKLAIDILYEAKEHLKKYKLVNLVETLNVEIKALENEVSKWDNIDQSVRERIKSSNFNIYINNALELADRNR